MICCGALLNIGVTDSIPNSASLFEFLICSLFFISIINLIFPFRPG